MDNALTFTNAKLVLKDTIVDGAVCVKDGVIDEIRTGKGLVFDSPHVDCGGSYLIPGLIDLHGDDIEYEIGAKGPKASPTRMPVELALLQSDRNSVAWGITSRLHAIAYWEEESKGRSKRLSADIIDRIGKLSDEGRLLAEHWVDLRYEITGDPAYTLEVMQHDSVRMISLMDHTPGEGQFKDDASYKALNKSISGFSDEELDRILEQKRNAQSAKRENMETVAAVARKRGQFIASHDDHLPEKVDAMKELGATIAEMPVTMEAARRARSLGQTVTMAAPNVLRGGSSSGNLNAVDAIKADVLDALCSDYYLPANMMAAFKLVADGVCPLPQAVGYITWGAARGMGLADRGSLAEGQRADLVVVEARADYPIAMMTVRCGKPVFRDSRF